MSLERHYFALRVSSGETLYGYGTDLAARAYCYRRGCAAQGLSPAEIETLKLLERYDVIDLDRLPLEQRLANDGESNG